MAVNILEEFVMVINRNYLALHVTTVREAMKLLVKDSAKVIDENYSLYTFEQWMAKSDQISLNQEEMEKYAGVVRTPSRVIVAPQAIHLSFADVKIEGLLKVKYSRRNIFNRDSNTCQYCGVQFSRSELTVDHVVPKSRGGRNSFTNIVAACIPCNSKKANKTPEEAGMQLLKSPFTPKWKSHTGLPFSKAKKSYWNVFL